MKLPRVLLADDHRMIREAIARLIDSHCEVLGMVGDGRAVLAEVPRLQPELVVLDVAMPILNGLDTARQLRRVAPEVKIIILTMSEDSDIATEAFRAGAKGYVLKSSSGTELLRAIRLVSRGRSYVTPLATQNLIDNLLQPPEPETKHDELTLRQREVLQLLAEGHTMKEIAGLLDITPRTVAFHKYAIMRLLQIKSTAELVQAAVRRHLIAI